MIDWTSSAYWGALNALISFNCALLALRLLMRAAHDPKRSGARIIYGAMFAAISIFFGILAISQWRFADGRPAAGLVALALLWAATTIAVLYLLVWGRPRNGGVT